jgi:hypothetical protein
MFGVMRCELSRIAIYLKVVGLFLTEILQCRGEESPEVELVVQKFPTHRQCMRPLRGSALRGSTGPREPWTSFSHALECLYFLRTSMCLWSASCVLKISLLCSLSLYQQRKSVAAMSLWFRSAKSLLASIKGRLIAPEVRDTVLIVLI